MKLNWKGNFYLPEPPAFETWAQYLRAARDYVPQALNYADEAPWSQSAFASLLGVDANYISMIERGDREPGLQ